MSEHSGGFINRALSRALPPESPLLIDAWSGMAFDRNRYESFAPADVWDAWLSSHTRISRSPSIIAVASVPDIDSGLTARHIGAGLSSLEKYWREDANFLTDHYVFSATEEWIIRLDQDVTIFAGRSEFVRDVVAILGGYDRVLARMDDDFAPGKEDAAGLGRYLKKLLRNIA